MRVLPWRTAAVVLGAGLTTAAVTTVGLAPAAAARAAGPGHGHAGASTAARLAAPTRAAVRPTLASPGRAASFTVSCASLDTAAAMLLGQPLGLPALIPMNAAALQGDFAVTVQLPRDLRPGAYRPRIECSDGTSATVALRVESAQAAAAARAAAASERAAAAAPASPVSLGLAAGGVALMAIGALAGGSALALRRRLRA